MYGYLSLFSLFILFYSAVYQNGKFLHSAGCIFLLTLSRSWCLYLKVSGKFVYLIVQDRFRVVHMSFGRMFKFLFLVQFPGNHLPHSVVSSQILFFSLIFCINFRCDWSFCFSWYLWWIYVLLLEEIQFLRIFFFLLRTFVLISRKQQNKKKKKKKTTKMRTKVCYKKRIKSQIKRPHLKRFPNINDSVSILMFFLS